LEHSPERLFVRESNCKFERGMSLSRDIHHLRTNVDGFPFFGRNGGQMIGRAATHRQDLLIRLNQEPKKSAHEFVIISVALYPTLAANSNFGQMIAGPLASLLESSGTPCTLLRLGLT